MNAVEKNRAKTGYRESSSWDERYVEGWDTILSKDLEQWEKTPPG